MWHLTPGNPGPRCQKDLGLVTHRAWGIGEGSRPMRWEWAHGAMGLDQDVGLRGGWKRVRPRGHVTHDWQWQLVTQKANNSGPRGEKDEVPMRDFRYLSKARLSGSKGGRTVNDPIFYIYEYLLPVNDFHNTQRTKKYLQDDKECKISRLRYIARRTKKIMQILWKMVQGG